MKKFHWGHGIFVFYIIFIATLVMVLIESRKVDHSLVRKDYYALDLAYQDRYDALSSAKSENKLQIDYLIEEEKLIVEFEGQDSPTGEILFYRPSDQSMDFDMPIDNSTMAIQTNKIVPGLWKIKVNWTYRGKRYYHEEKIYI